MTYADGRYGALDIGTVTCRLLVADVEDGRIIDVDKEYAITDLGVGVDATGRLSEAAIERVLACVDRYLEVLARYDTPEHPVRRLIAMATSASRDAANGPEFAARLAERGITLAVIPGSREAQLTFLGASSDFPGENLLVVDIGGGSTEVVAGRFGEDPIASHSFNIGCRRVTERFFHDDPPTAGQMDAARQWIRETMAPYFEGLATAGFAIDRVVAVAGTATSVVSIREAMKPTTPPVCTRPSSLLESLRPSRNVWPPSRWKSAGPRWASTRSAPASSWPDSSFWKRCWLWPAPTPTRPANRTSSTA